MRGKKKKKNNNRPGTESLCVDVPLSDFPTAPQGESARHPQGTVYQEAEGSRDLLPTPCSEDTASSYLAPRVLAIGGKGKSR